jgi:hypothetical protein
MNLFGVSQQEVGGVLIVMTQAGAANMVRLMIAESTVSVADCVRKVDRKALSDPVFLDAISQLGNVRYWFLVGWW